MAIKNLPIKNLRDETILFKVTAREKAAIERFAKKKGWTVSEYIRVTALFDMMLSGDLEAASIVSGSVKEKLQEKMRALIHESPSLVESKR